MKFNIQIVLDDNPDEAFIDALLPMITKEGVTMERCKKRKGEYIIHMPYELYNQVVEKMKE